MRGVTGDECARDSLSQGLDLAVRDINGTIMARIASGEHARRWVALARVRTA